MTARESRLFFKLQMAAHLLQKIADQEIGTVSSLSTSQAAVLSILANKEGSNQKHIAQQLRQNESGITAMIARLERQGFVSKERSQTDGRAWELAITKSGQKELNATKEPFSRVNTLLEEMLTTGELAMLAEILEKIAAGAPD